MNDCINYFFDKEIIDSPVVLQLKHVKESRKASSIVVQEVPVSEKSGELTLRHFQLGSCGLRLRINE